MAESQLKVKQKRLREQLEEYHYDAQKLSEPITEPVIVTSNDIVEESRYTTKAIEGKNEKLIKETHAASKALEVTIVKNPKNVHCNKKLTESIEI